MKSRVRPNFIDWMENNYILSGGTSAVEGPWSAEYTPYFAEPAKWLSDTATREVWIYACSQSGKTTMGSGFIGYVADCAPAPAMVIMPTKDDAKNRIEARIRPMFRDNSDLLAHVRGRNVNNIFIGKQTVLDNMILYIGWPTPQAMADKPVCYILADEVGKYPPYVGHEADPINLLRDRQRWFKSRSKFLGTTTPVIEDDMADQNWKRGDRCELWGRCPYCGKWRLIIWENVRIDRFDLRGKKTFYAESVYRKGGKCRYVCPQCKAHWTEDDRWNAVKRGRYVPAGFELNDEGRFDTAPPATDYRSCRVHALLLHPMVETVTDMVCKFVIAQKARELGNIEPLKNFWNSELARPWKETRAETDIEKVRTHIGTYPAMKVPPGAEMLTAGLDVQLDHVFLRILAWGYLAEFWSIFEQRIETGPTERLENLEKVVPYLVRRWPSMAEQDVNFRLAAAAIDRSYNTEAVDALCVRLIGAVNLLPVAGDDGVKKQPWRAGSAAGGRIKRYDLNVTMYKDALYRSYFEAVNPGPGYGHLHKETHYTVLEQLCSEHKIIEQKGGKITWVGWSVKKDGLANHYWDCDVYARAAAEIAGLWSIPDPSARETKPLPVEGRPVGRRPLRTKY